jgi:hypothetical protein
MPSVTSGGKRLAELAIKVHPTQKRKLTPQSNLRYNRAIVKHHFMSHIRENVMSRKQINENSPYSVPLNYGTNNDFEFMKRYVIPKLTNKALRKFIKYAST